MVATPVGVWAALAAAGYADKCRGILTGAVITVLVLGLCLCCGQGYASVIGRLWPLLASFNPVIVLSEPVTAVALSQARSRLPAGVLQAVFQAGAAAGVAATATAGSVMFGLVVTAVDGTVLDLAATDAIRARFGTPSGGRFPHARVVTLVACGTRRVLAAQAPDRADHHAITRNQDHKRGSQDASILSGGSGLRTEGFAQSVCRTNRIVIWLDLPPPTQTRRRAPPPPRRCC
ncbi:MAG TPA: transposase domain-containing protein [Mycobacteriales bacterium]|nr:transposase domain-containing protein [Mycobacteriales bacterium]